MCDEKTMRIDEEPVINFTFADHPRSQVIRVKRSLMKPHSTSTYVTDEATDLRVSSFAAFKALLGFMETGELCPTMENVESLLKDAHYLRLDSALQVLFLFLVDDMLKRDVLAIDRYTLMVYLRSVNYNRIGFEWPKKKAIVIDYDGRTRAVELTLNPMFIISCNFQEIMYEKSVLDLSLENMCAVLTCWALNITEEDVVRSIKMWINHDYRRRQRHFDQMITCMRYDPDMKIDFLIEELLCRCTAKCKCLNAANFVLVVLANRHGYQKEFKKGAGPLYYDKRVRVHTIQWIKDE